MNSQQLLQQAQALGPSERIWLVEAIWDQIESEAVAGLTDAQLAEIRRRDAHSAAHPDEAMPARTEIAQLRHAARG